MGGVAERFIRVLVVAGGTFAASLTPAAAQNADQNWKYCINYKGAYSYDLAIGGCTALIQSGQQTTEDLATAFFNRGSAYQSGPQHDYARAIADYTQTIALDPQYADAFYNRGIAYQYGPQPDYASAIAHLTQAIALDPQNVDAFYNRGIAYQYGPQPDYASAIADLTQAIALDPQDADFFFNRGDAYQSGPQHDYARAIADYTQAIVLNPQNASLLNSRCWVRAVWGQELDQALADCDASLRIANSLDTLDSRGLVHLRRGEFQAAFADYDAAVHGDDGLIDSLYGRGIARLRLGQTNAGKADIAAATARDANIAVQFTGYGVTP
ncbi:MAG: tetratricopeptide repeat protein [Hyphomonadaceae bacterium]